MFLKLQSKARNPFSSLTPPTDETDGLFAIINKFDESTKEANRVADQADCDIRDYGKTSDNEQTFDL